MLKWIYWFLNYSIYRVRNSKYRVDNLIYRVRNSIYRVLNSIYRLLRLIFLQLNIGGLLSSNAICYLVYNSIYRVDNSIYPVLNSIYRLLSSIYRILNWIGLYWVLNLRCWVLNSIYRVINSIYWVLSWSVLQSGMYSHLSPSDDVKGEIAAIMVLWNKHLVNTQLPRYGLLSHFFHICNFGAASQFDPRLPNGTGTLLPGPTSSPYTIYMVFLSQ